MRKKIKCWSRIGQVYLSEMKILWDNKNMKFRIITFAKHVIMTSLKLPILTKSWFIRIDSLVDVYITLSKYLP